MMDFFSGLFAMREEYEAHGKTWVLIESIQQNSEKTGWYYLAVEKGTRCPSPVQLIFKENPTTVLDKKESGS
jgi:hypothetical protein